MTLTTTPVIWLAPAPPCSSPLGGAAVVVGGMLLVGVRELSVARFIPDFATLQSLIVG